MKKSRSESQNVEPMKGNGGGSPRAEEKVKENARELQVGPKTIDWRKEGIRQEEVVVTVEGKRERGERDGSRGRFLHGRLLETKINVRWSSGL